VGRQIVESVSALDPNVMVSVSIEKACDKCEIANSRGLWVSHESTSYSVSVSAEIVEGENFLQVYDVASSASAGIPVDDMVSRIKQKIVSGRKNAKISSGKYPVLFTPLALADILRPILACANGTAVHKGFSPFKDKLGERLFAASFDLYCDSVRDGSPSSTPFDAEGVAARRLPIVKEGILEQFMLDLRTASLLRRAATGSAVRHSVDSAPDIGVVGLELSPGDGALDKMVAQIRKGLIVDLLMGAWSGNPFGGVVNGNVMLGFVVEDGEVVGRCKDVMLSCNVFEALREQIIAISKEREDRGETLFPHVLLDGLGVAARA